MTYPGGKNGSGVYQKLINLMPPHQTYIEPFLGGGAIMRIKKPAPANIGIDIDADVVQRFHRENPDLATELHICSALDWLAPGRSSLYYTNPRTLIYLDPPYLMSVRYNDTGQASSPGSRGFYFACIF